MAHGFPDWSPLATGQDSELPTYRANRGDELAAGAADQWLYNLFNPANSGTLARVRYFGTLVKFLQAEDAVATHVLTCFRTTSLGTGTALTPVKHDTAKPAAVLQVVYAITVAPGFSASQIFSAHLVNERKAALQSARFATPVIPVDFLHHEPAGQVEPVKLRPGEGLGILVSNINMTFLPRLLAIWTEEPAGT